MAHNFLNDILIMVLNSFGSDNKLPFAILNILCEVTTTSMNNFAKIHYFEI